MQDDCTFCRIANGGVPSFKILEDEDIVAFLDANPATDGHTLVAPRDHATGLTDLDPEQTAALFDTVRTATATIEDALDPAGVNIIQSNGAAAGQEVFHVHVHIVPRYEEDGVTIDFESTELDEERADKLTALLAELL
ncbi:HIT family protein [Halococcus agarilyticus]|uniref:HIT family protein n=1 Tax=Halococcus agarilyticus TaxID=1232219 RepID=UPI0006781039|nr:HIT family protein [Halococcus agarilyticus]